MVSEKGGATTTPNPAWPAALVSVRSPCSFRDLTQCQGRTRQLSGSCYSLDQVPRELPRPFHPLDGRNAQDQPRGAHPRRLARRGEGPAARANGIVEVKEEPGHPGRPGPYRPPVPARVDGGM